MSAGINFSSISLKKDGRCGFTSSYQTKVKLNCLRHRHCHLVLMMYFATRVCIAEIVNIRHNHLLILSVQHENPLTNSYDRANKKHCWLSSFIADWLWSYPCQSQQGRLPWRRAPELSSVCDGRPTRARPLCSPAGRQTDRQSYTCIHKAVGNIYFVIQEVHIVWTGQVNNVTNLILLLVYFNVHLLALIYQASAETSSDSCVNIILCHCPCQIHERYESGQFQHMNEHALINEGG